MNKLLMLVVSAVAASSFVACSNENDGNSVPVGTEGVVPGKNHKILVAYVAE